MCKLCGKPRMHRLHCFHCGGVKVVPNACDHDSKTNATTGRVKDTRDKVFHRDKNERGNNMSSNAENNAQLHASAETVSESAIAPLSAAMEPISAISRYIQASIETIEDSTQTTALLIGEGTEGLNTVVGSAAMYSENAERVRGLLSQLELELDTLKSDVQRHAEVMRGVAQGGR